jgi:Protein of unknown function (DUF2568)
MAIAMLTLRFITELAGVVAVGYAAFQIEAPTPVRLLAAVVAAIGFAVVWGVVAAPRTQNGLTQPTKDAIGTALLLAAAGLLAVAGQPGVALGFAVVVVANTAVLFALGPDARDVFAEGRS